MIEEILCQAKKRVRSIVNLCEEFAIRRFVQQANQKRLKIVNDCAILCDARRQKRSIADLCEHFDVRRTRAKRANQNDFLSQI